MKDTVLVTGASGFVVAIFGIWRLAGSRRLEHRPRLTGRRLDPGDTSICSIAIGSARRIRELRPAQIYHCAGVTHVAESWRDTAQPLAGNVLATHHLLDALRRAGVRCRVLVPGSATVYAPSPSPSPRIDAIAPASPYAVSKLAQEQLALRAMQEDGLEVVVTRSFNHTGPRQTPAFAAPSMARQIALIERGQIEPVIRVGNLDARRDITDVRDVVRAYVALMKSGTAGRRLQRGLGRRPLHPIGARRAGLTIARARAHRNRPGAHAAERRARPSSATTHASTRATGWQPDGLVRPDARRPPRLLAHRRRAARVARAGLRTCRRATSWRTYDEYSASLPWKSRHFSSISAGPTPRLARSLTSSRPAAPRR